MAFLLYRLAVCRYIRISGGTENITGSNRMGKIQVLD
jgi:hypothetical protein